MLEMLPIGARNSIGKVLVSAGNVCIRRSSVNYQKKQQAQHGAQDIGQQIVYAGHTARDEKGLDDFHGYAQAISRRKGKHEMMIS